VNVDINDCSMIYDKIINKVKIITSEGNYKSILSHESFKNIILGLSNKEIVSLIKFLKIYRKYRK